MINLTKGNIDSIYITAVENISSGIASPYYYFIFTNRTTGNIVNVTLGNSSTSLRYDKCVVTVNDYFEDEDEGFWTYQVKSRISATGTIGSAVLETGYMYLRPSTEFSPTEYADQNNDFVTYNGQ